MSNEEILQQRWEKTDKTLQQYLKKFNALGNETIDKVMEVFDNINITFSDLNKTISKAEKRRLDRNILEWKEKGLLTGYFEYLVLSKSNFTYADLLEIMIYSIYVEQEQKQNKLAKNVFIIVAEDIYNQAKKEIPIKPKKFSLTWEYIWSLLWIPTYNKKWDEYLKLLTLTSEQEIYKQLLVNIQNNRPLLEKDLKPIIKKQMNRIISINDDKYSGILSDTCRQLGNKIYIDPFKNEKDLQVRFIAEMDKRTTKMCEGMNNMLFYVNGWNKFYRYSDVDKKDVYYVVKGLEQGINLPPINNHFHWCRSTITYQLKENIIEDVRSGINYIKLSDIEQYNNYVDILGEERVGNLDNFVKIKYNNDSSEWEILKHEFRKFNTVISGARNGSRIKTLETKEKHANMFYEAVRKRTGDSIRISNNTKWSIEDIEKIRKYIFVDKHKLGDKEERFDPDYDMAVSWQRLNDGKNIKEHDLILLEHEYYEMELIEKGYSQHDAHIEASKKYNYNEGVNKYNDRSKKS